MASVTSTPPAVTGSADLSPATLTPARPVVTRVTQALLVPDRASGEARSVLAAGTEAVPTEAGRPSRVVLLLPAPDLDGLSVPTADLLRVVAERVPVDVAARSQVVGTPGVRLHGPVPTRVGEPGGVLDHVVRRLGAVPALVVLVGRGVTAGAVGDVLDLLWDRPGTLVMVASDLGRAEDLSAADDLARRLVVALAGGDAGQVGHEVTATPAVRALLDAARRRHLERDVLAVGAATDPAGGGALGAASIGFFLAS